MTAKAGKIFRSPDLSPGEVTAARFLTRTAPAVPSALVCTAVRATECKCGEMFDPTRCSPEVVGKIDEEDPMTRRR